jgi:hypothetical protein
MLHLVTTGLDPVVHAEMPNAIPLIDQLCVAAWIAGSSPAMTNQEQAIPFSRSIRTRVIVTQHLKIRETEINGNKSASYQRDLAANTFVLATA